MKGGDNRHDPSNPHNRPIHHVRMIRFTHELDSASHSQLDAFITTHGTLDHDPRWLSVLQNAMGHRPMSLVAQDEHGVINGYLPLALVTSRLFGRFLVSLPYLNRAGLLVKNDDPQVTAELIDQAVLLADMHQVDYLELRHDAAHEHDKLGFRRDEKVRMVLDLSAMPDADALWSHFNAKVRNQIRKGEKNNLSIRFGRDAAMIDAFYDIFSVNMRDLGTPVYSRGLFERIIALFPDESELAVVTHDNQPIAGAMLIHDRTSTTVPSASCLRAFNATNANMWMYHQLLLRTIERGNTAFDFGRSSEDSGTYRFKKQWGAVPHSTVWQYHVRRGDVQRMRPDAPGNRRKVEAWKKLPVWVTKLAGPSIVRGIP